MNTPLAKGTLVFSVRVIFSLSCLLFLFVACPQPEPVYDDDLGLQAISVEPGSLAGKFAQKHSILSVSDLPILGEQVNGGETYMLVDRTWNEESETYSQVSTVCNGVSYETGGTTTTILKDTWRSVPPSEGDELTVDHELGTYQLKRHLQLWGIDLPDPYETPMPASQAEALQSPHSERIYDADGDGHPGTTLFLDGFIVAEVYFIQRKELELDGYIVEDDLFTGLARADYEQVTIGSDNSSVNDSIKKEDHPNPKESWFEEIRLSDDADCNDVDNAILEGKITRLNPFL